MMENILTWVWQFPQTLAGFIISKALKTEKKTFYFFGQPPVIYSVIYYCFKSDTKLKQFLSGVSLGGYIILPETSVSLNTVRHEYGHSLQSRYLGWFYLLVIGLPSLIGNLLRRKFKFDYYKQPWEKWADELGGAVRD